MEGRDYKELEYSFKKAISEAFVRNRNVFSECGNLSPSQVRRLDLYYNPDEPWDLLMMSSSVDNILDYLHHATGKHVVVLVDDYNIIAWRAKELSCFEKFHATLEMFFMALKDNGTVFRAVLTGTTNYQFPGLFQSVFGFASHYGLQNSIISTFFGFTEKEVKVLLEGHGLENKLNDIRGYYDGFLCGSKSNHVNLVPQQGSATSFRRICQ